MVSEMFYKNGPESPDPFARILQQGGPKVTKGGTFLK